MIEIVILAVVLGVELTLYIKQCKNPKSSKLYSDVIEKLLNEKNLDVKEAQKDEVK